MSLSPNAHESNNRMGFFDIFSSDERRKDAVAIDIDVEAGVTV